MKNSKKLAYQCVKMSSLGGFGVAICGRCRQRWAMLGLLQYIYQVILTNGKSS